MANLRALPIILLLVTLSFITPVTPVKATTLVINLGCPYPDSQSFAYFTEVTGNWVVLINGTKLIGNYDIYLHGTYNGIEDNYVRIDFHRVLGEYTHVASRVDVPPMSWIFGNNQYVHAESDELMTISYTDSTKTLNYEVNGTDIQQVLPTTMSLKYIERNFGGDANLQLTIIGGGTIVEPPTPPPVIYPDFMWIAINIFPILIIISIPALVTYRKYGTMGALVGGNIGLFLGYYFGSSIITIQIVLLGLLLDALIIYPHVKKYIPGGSE